MSLIAELKRRNVIRAGAMYLALAWLVVQVAETVLPLFEVDDGLLRVGVIALAVGFVPTLLFAWFFEWTPEGIVPDAQVDHGSPPSSRRALTLDRLLVLVLVLGLSFFAWDKFILDPERDASELAAAREAAIAEGRSEARSRERSASIAVLPFRDRSVNGDMAYFCEGLAEDILNDLAKIASLRVTARTSSFSYEPGEATAAEIGDALNVAHILEGSVSQSGDRLRIAVQLVDAASATTLWSEDYDRTMDDVFAIRDDISARVVAQLPVRVVTNFGGSQRTDPEAYALTLRARATLQAGLDNDTATARALIDQALALDPDYIPALVNSFIIDYALVRDGSISAELGLQRYGETVERIFALDPQNAMALTAEAFGRWDAENNWELAAEEYARALRAAPGNVEVLRLSAQFARLVGRSDVAIALLERVAALDPLNAGNLFALPRTYLTAGRYQDAVAWFELHEQISGGAIYYYTMALLMQGQHQQIAAGPYYRQQRIKQVSASHGNTGKKQPPAQGELHPWTHSSATRSAPRSDAMVAP